MVTKVGVSVAVGFGKLERVRVGLVLLAGFEFPLFEGVGVGVLSVTLVALLI